MKPTDEAKRLQDEIAKTLRKHKQNYGLTFDNTDKIIGKVLDVVCMEVNNVGLSAHDTLATKTAINKLRPKP